MSKHAPELTAEQRAALAAWEDRRLTAEEFDARVHAPWTEHEREQFEELVRWFQRRYPTPRDRLAATRRLAASWYRRSDGRG